MRGLSSGVAGRRAESYRTEGNRNTTAKNNRNDEGLLEAIYITSQPVPAIIREVDPWYELITAADPVVL